MTAHVGVKIDLQNGIMSQQDARRVVCIAPSPVGCPAWHHHVRHLGEAMPGRIDENIAGIVIGTRIPEFNRLVTHFERHLLALKGPGGQRAFGIGVNRKDAGSFRMRDQFRAGKARR